jgi:hypothetical protein
MNREIVYPSWGLSYLINSPLDLLKNRLDGKDILQFRVASQPNSNPHLGTITTLFTTFALAEYARNYLNKDSYVFFECLTNSPDYSTKKSLNDLISYKNLEGSNNIKLFTKLLDYAYKFSGVKYVEQDYHSFIKDINVRSYLLDILQDNKLLFLIQPQDNNWHLRVPCPQCQYSQKDYNSNDVEVYKDKLIITSTCLEHGTYKTEFTVDNDQFIEVNTQIRTLLKGLLTSNIETNTHILPVWVDSSDWSGEWALRIFAEALYCLDVKTLPQRLFAPSILDWSGAKFSKSLYINNTNYLEQYKTFTSLDNILLEYGEDKLKELYKECYSWVTSSSKFFRHYTVDYFKEVFSL